MKGFSLAPKFQGQRETVAWPKVIRPRTHVTVILLHRQHCLSVLLRKSKFQHPLLCVYLPKQRVEKSLITSISPLCLHDGPDLKQSVYSLILQHL